MATTFFKCWELFRVCFGLYLYSRLHQFADWQPLSVVDELNKNVLFTRSICKFLQYFI